jgi:hypothetical protein
MSDLAALLLCCFAALLLCCFAALPRFLQTPRQALAQPQPVVAGLKQQRHRHPNWLGVGIGWQQLPDSPTS